MHKKIFAGALLGLITASSAVAETPDWNDKVATLTQKQGRVERLFDGPEGIKGIVIGPSEGVPSEGRILAWGLPSGLLMVGNLYDRQGRNLSEVVHTDKPGWFAAATVEEVATVTTAKNVTNGDILWRNAATKIPSHATLQGSGTKRAYVFIDATCPYCKKLYNEIAADKDFLKKFQIAWVPVTRDGQNFSTGSILSGDMSVMNGKAQEITDDQKKAVIENVEWLKELGGRVATPGFLYLKNGTSTITYGINKEKLEVVLNR